MTHVVYQVLKLLVLTHSTMGKTATQQANKNAITLRGSAEIVAEFFSEWIYKSLAVFWPVVTFSVY